MLCRVFILFITQSLLNNNNVYCFGKDVDSLIFSKHLKYFYTPPSSTLWGPLNFPWEISQSITLDVGGDVFLFLLGETVLQCSAHCGKIIFFIILIVVKLNSTRQCHTLKKKPKTSGNKNSSIVC